MALSSADSTTPSGNSPDLLSSSTTVTSSSLSQHPSQSLDDVFGPVDLPDHCLDVSGSAPATEPSDIPFLRRQHVTAGYRDGVSAAKHQHVQRGFDTGFPVGAGLGMRAGVVLGILEGLVRCGAANNAHVQEMYEAARRELRVEVVFGDVNGEGDRDGEDPCVQLGRRGEDKVAHWERRLKQFLAESG